MSTGQPILTPDLARHFLSAFRAARYQALQDAEGYQELLFCLERLGTAITGEIGTLGAYKDAISRIARSSSLAEQVARRYRDVHVPFPQLYELVRQGRNDAMHQGAFARMLTVHATQLALVLEDAFMEKLTCVSDYMVRGPVCAQLWHPMSFIRQQMLEASFSYLPFFREKGDDSDWYLISDRAIAKYLSVSRKQRLAQPLVDALDTDDGPEVEKARIYSPDEHIQTVLTEFEGSPVLICRKDDPGELVGILTAFDML